MKKLFIIYTVLIAASCTNPLDKKYNSKTFIEDAKEIDTTDSKIIVATVFRSAIEKKEIEGLTYRELLNQGKIYKAEQERIAAEEMALAEKAATEEAQRIAKLKDALTVTVFAKGFDEGRIRSYISYKFVFQNKTPQDIRAFTGQISFTDLFDKEIKRFNITYDQTIKRRATVNWEAQTDYNEFKDEDVRLANKPLENLKVVWYPEKILFGGGSYLE